MFKNGSHITEEHIKVLELIGEEKVKLLIFYLGATKISLLPIKEYLNEQAVKKSLESNKPVKQIAKEVGVHKSTVYRIEKRMKRK